MLIKQPTIPAQPRSTAILCCQKNLMPLSWHMPISREPFRYAIAVRDENITYNMLKDHGSFTLNFLPFSYHETEEFMETAWISSRFAILFPLLMIIMAI